MKTTATDSIRWIVNFLLNRIELTEGHLKKFLDGTIKLKPEDKAGKFETDGELSVAHNASALEGQTDVPNRDDKVDLHFIAMVENEGCLYELGEFSIELLFQFLWNSWLE